MILKFDAVHARVGARHDLRDVELAAPPGAALAVVGKPSARAALADLAIGLRDPDHGDVWFDGRTWRGLGPTARADTRGLIGCALDRQAWLSNLDVYENLVLAERIHSGRDVATILAEARGLADRLGLGTIEDGRPHLFHATTLRNLAIVRALLGQRKLLVLENAELALPAEALARLFRVLDERRADGAALLWLASSAAPDDLGATARSNLELHDRHANEEHAS